MTIRNSTEQDFTRIMEIYAFAREYMKMHGNPNQWGPTNWPPEQLIHSDIKNGNSYVCTNDSGEVIGTFYFTQGKDIEPTYRLIEGGKWTADAPYGVVHRVATAGKMPGVGSFILRWALRQAGYLRIDTHPDNTVMQSLLRKLGFRQCGIIHVTQDPDPRLAFDLNQEG